MTSMTLGSLPLFFPYLLSVAFVCAQGSKPYMRVSPPMLSRSDESSMSGRSLGKPEVLMLHGVLLLVYVG